MGKVIELAEERLDGKKMEEAAIIEIDCEQDCVRLEKMIQESFNPRKKFRDCCQSGRGNHRRSRCTRRD